MSIKHHDQHSYNTYYVYREHVNDEYSMTNLFCNQIRKLSLQDLGDMGKGSKKSSRCGFHTKGSKKTVSMFSWIETWYGMVDKCREEVVLLPFSSIRSTLDTYLRRHKFCSECRGMVNKAYKLLIDTGEVMLDRNSSILEVLLYGIFRSPSRQQEKNVPALHLR